MAITAYSDLSQWNTTLKAAASSNDTTIPLPLKNSEKLVVNLDSISSSYIKNLYGKKALSSCDALFCKNDKYYFIEFKNQVEKNIDSNDVRAKAFSSLLIANFVLCPQCSISELSNQSDLFVVFKDSKEPNYLNKLASELKILANLSGEPLFFNLREYVDKGIYKEIHTIPASVFNEKYSDYIFL